ncbi:hypothetical protein ACB098_11G040200 [Castanea mollissima]
MYTKGTPTLSTKNTTIKHLKHIGKRKETRSIHPLNKKFGEWKLSHQEQREKRPEAFWGMKASHQEQIFHNPQNFGHFSLQSAAIHYTISHCIFILLIYFGA